MNKNFFYFYICNFLTFCVLLLFLNACSGIKPVSCFENKMKNIDIKWGTIVKDKISTYYRMQSNGRITIMKQDSTFKTLGTFEESKACKIFNEINRALLKVQACMDPGDTLKFITIDNLETDFSVRTRWNPKFNSENTKTLNKLSDSLDVYIKNIN